MNGYSQDVFDEMDVVFDRLLAQMQQGMLAKNQPISGYRIVIEGTGFSPADPDLVRVQPRARENPQAEVHCIDDEVRIVTELPGAPEESIRIGLQGQHLTIDAGDPDMPYQTSADLPPVDAGTMQKSFRNGVLEVTFRLRPGEQPQS